MEFVHTQKFIRISPTKVRPVVGMIKDMKPEDAIERLPYIYKRGSIPVEKVLKTAVANAKEQGVQVQDLKIKEIQVGEGPRIKRGRPVSRGSYHPYKKRMCHIRVTLELVEKRAAKNAKKKNEKIKSIEKGKRISAKKKGASKK
ncbi:50S ribosomal protein L22 [Patescibacteria group bacterium]